MRYGSSVVHMDPNPPKCAAVGGIGVTVDDGQTCRNWCLIPMTDGGVVSCALDTTDEEWNLCVGGWAAHEAQVSIANLALPACALALYLLLAAYSRG